MNGNDYQDDSDDGDENKMRVPFYSTTFHILHVVILVITINGRHRHQTSGFARDDL